jgi:hypothetical protein
MAIEVIARILPLPAEEFDKMVASIQDRHPGSGRNLKWTLIGLANHADATTGYCFPGVMRLARYTGLTKRSVQRALKQAEVVGLIKRRKRVDMSSEYLLNFRALPEVDEEVFSKESKETDFFWSEEPDLFEGALPHATDDKTPCHGGTPPMPPATRPHASLAPKTSVGTSEETSEETSGCADAQDDDVGTDLVVAEDLPLKDFIAAEWKKLKTDFPEIGDCRRVTDQMVNLIKQRTKEHRVDGESDHDLWRTVFERIRSSHFLTGRAPPTAGRTRFHLTLSWLLKPHLFREVINGKYTSSRADDGAFDPSTGEVLGPAAAATRGTIQRLRDARQRPAGGGNPRQAGFAG